SASPGRRTFSACLGAEVRRLPPRSRQASHRSKLRRRKDTLRTAMARLGSRSPNLAPSPSAGGGGGRAGPRREAIAARAEGPERGLLRELEAERRADVPIRVAA